MDLFVAMYVRKEALVSSQIEGTQCTLDDVLDPNIETNINGDVSDVVNYIKNDFTSTVNNSVDSIKNNTADILSEMDDQIATEERDPCKIEDKGDNLGDDIGPGHDKNGVSKPCCDTSDMDIIDAVSGGTFADDCQYNSGDNAQGKVTDGHQPNGDFHVAGDDDKSSDDSFSEKGSLLDREDDYEDLIMNDVDDTPEKKLSSSELEKLNANEDDELMLGLI